MLKCAVILLNAFMVSSYLTLNVELIIGLSLLLVFFIIYQGSRKIGLVGAFLAVDSMYYFYYYLLTLNSLILSVLKLLLEKVNILSNGMHPASFLVMANGIFHGRVLKAYTSFNWLALSALGYIIWFFSYRVLGVNWSAKASLGLEGRTLGLFANKVASVVRGLSEGTVYVG